MTEELSTAKEGDTTEEYEAFKKQLESLDADEMANNILKNPELQSKISILSCEYHAIITGILWKLSILSPEDNIENIKEEYHTLLGDALDRVIKS